MAQKKKADKLLPAGFAAIFGELLKAPPGGVVGQRVKTPLPETGVDLDPQTPSGLNLLPSIQRAWATLWAWDGSAFRRLRCNRDGFLQTVPITWDGYESRVVTGTITGGSWGVADLTEEYEYVTAGFTTGGIWGRAQFSLDGVTYNHDRLFTPAGGFVNIPIFEIWLRTRYINLYPGGTASPVDYILVGERVAT